MRIIRLHQGKNRIIKSIVTGKDIPIYHDELFPNIEDRLRHKINLHIQFLSDRKFPVENKTICEQLVAYGNLYELKPKPARLLFFMIGNDAIITHGFIKKKQKLDKREIERAISLRDKCLKEME